MATRDAIARASVHPLRAMSLRILTERIASPKEISQILDEPIRSVSHQVGRLRTDGLIELVEERKRGGVPEHFYRAVPGIGSDPDDFAEADLSTRQLMTTVTVQLMVGDLTRAMKLRSFDLRPDRHLSRVAMTVDRQGWSEISAIFLRAMDEATAVGVASEQRLAGDDSDAAPVVAMLGLFDSPL